MDSQPDRLLLPGNGPRAIFVAGKGGVGKTTVSCAIALRLAECGYRTLLVTTDPAAHTGNVFQQPVTDHIRPVASVAGLWVVRVDPKAATEEYKRTTLEEARPRYAPEMLAALAEELESPCTEELAAFDKFSRFLTDESFDVTVFDTAPTGHTLRLLQLPFDYSQQVGLMVAAGQESVGLKEKTRARFERMIAKLQDPNRTTFVLVAYPESTPIVEAHRAAVDLQKAGIYTQLLVANQILPEERCTHPFFQKRRGMQMRRLAEMEAMFHLPILQMPLFEGEVVGLTRVRQAALALLPECGCALDVESPLFQEV